MKLKLIIAATLLAVTPALAQPAPPRPGPPPGPPPGQQQPQAPKPTEAQLQKVVNDIGANKAKMDSYCKLMKIQQQMGTLDEKKDAKKVEALAKQAVAEQQKLPGYERMMLGLEQVDENSPEFKDAAAAIRTLDAKCK